MNMGGDPGTWFDLKMPHPEGFGTVAGIHQDGPGDTWITLFRLGVGSVQDRHQFASFVGNISAITGLYEKLWFLGAMRHGDWGILYQRLTEKMGHTA
jgi:hypothetical protein